MGGRGLRRCGIRAALVLLAASLLSGGPMPAAAGAVAANGPSSASTGEAGFALPVGGRATVLTPFRPPLSRYGSGHRGVDLAVPVGATVLAAGGGVVVYAGQLAGRGVVSIDHPAGFRTTYEPVSTTVKAGERIPTGHRIGVLQGGHPSCAPAACLHWGVRLPDGSYLDPMGLLGGLEVRLLPWER